MGKKKKQREEMIQNQHSDYTKPAEYKILKKKTIKDYFAFVKSVDRSTPASK